MISRCWVRVDALVQKLHARQSHHVPSGRIKRQRYARLIVAMLDKAGYERVLEIGCGPFTHFSPRKPIKCLLDISYRNSSTLTARLPLLDLRRLLWAGRYFFLA